jgi:homocysteine S-methyltransferase
MSNPVRLFLEKQGVLILDGGLATQLEARGAHLQDPLWSARLLLENPALIRQVHLDYFWAGADCAITASYQATIPGFVQHGLTEAQAVELLKLPVQLAREAREEFWAVAGGGGRLRPLIAASIGPYGAYLANGAEYTGDYDLGEPGLVDFHRQRWHILAESAVDLLACETIPSLAEAKALAQLLRESPDSWAWFSFSCRDGRSISDGTPITECAALLEEMEQVVAVGINCTPPRHIPELIGELLAVTQKPIVVYPNSGEDYDAVTKRWHGLSAPAEFGTYSREWRKAGAALIGGCCRTGPEHIRQIRDRFRRNGRS